MSHEPTISWFDWAAKHLEDYRTSDVALQELFAPALEAIQYATHAAYLLGHECVGAEHLLAGLLKANRGSVPEVLRRSGINLPVLRREIENAHAKTGCNQAASTWPQSYTPRFRRVLETGKEKAVCRGSSHIDTGHLFLGLLHEREGLPSMILRKYHVDPAQIQLAVFQELGNEP